MATSIFPVNVPLASNTFNLTSVIAFSYSGGADLQHSGLLGYLMAYPRI
jgi:hypothetical protein